MSDIVTDIMSKALRDIAEGLDFPPSEGADLAGLVHTARATGIVLRRKQEAIERLHRARDAVRALLEDAAAARQLTPTELDIERLVAGQMTEAEVAQILRRWRG